MNSLIILVIQLISNILIWMYVQNNKDKMFLKSAGSLSQISAWFIASILMHLNVEKDVRLGDKLMKYVVNHYRNFRNPYAAFMLAFLHFLVTISIEMNVIYVLISI